MRKAFELDEMQNQDLAMLTESGFQDFYMKIRDEFAEKYEIDLNQDNFHTAFRAMFAARCINKCTKMLIDEISDLECQCEF